MRRSSAIFVLNFAAPALLAVVTFISIIVGLRACEQRELDLWHSEGITAASIQIAEAALNQYRFDTGAYPTREQGLAALVPKYLEPNFLKQGTLRDYWNRECLYSCPGLDGREFEIVSRGKDGLLNTEDDIQSWRLD